MALIKCPECGHEVSDEALSCPNCGHPFKSINQITQQSPVIIEQTTKKWKWIKLVSAIFLIIGFFLFLSGLSTGGFENVKTGLGLTITFLSFIALLVGKFGAWWTNR
jgi:uncharacterized membrane protein YvbJ